VVTVIILALLLFFFWFIPVFLQVISWAAVAALVFVLLVGVLGLLRSPRRVV
jgi:hypothetical protein